MLVILDRWNMLNEIKNDIKSKLNKKVNIILNETRSKKIKCIGIIKEIYPNVFSVEIDGKIYSYSYSYSDILIKKIIIK